MLQPIGQDQHLPAGHFSGAPVRPRAVSIQQASSLPPLEPLPVLGAPAASGVPSPGALTPGAPLLVALALLVPGAPTPTTSTSAAPAFSLVCCGCPGCLRPGTCFPHVTPYGHRCAGHLSDAALSQRCDRRSSCAFTDLPHATSLRLCSCLLSMSVACTRSDATTVSSHGAPWSCDSTASV